MNDQETFLKATDLYLHATGGSVVYAIGRIKNERVDAIKIGTTRHRMTKRFGTIQTGSPDELNLMAVAPGGPNTERKFHEANARSRIRGEWFGHTDQVGAYIWMQFYTSPVRLLNSIGLAHMVCLLGDYDFARLKVMARQISRPERSDVLLEENLDELPSKVPIIEAAE